MKEKVIRLFKVILFYTKDIILHFPHYAVKTFRVTVIFTSFFAMLFLFMISLCISFFRKIPLLSILIKKLDVLWAKVAQPLYSKLIDKLESLRPFKIKRQYLIYVAFQNLLIRKSRSLITIFGMSIGVGIIVYLLSLGYGIERLVISQVASLEELQMVDVSAGETSKAILSKEAVRKMSKFEQVKKVIPMISVVGRLNYNNAKTDILVYAVPKDYFVAARPDMLEGKYFTSNMLQEQDLYATERGQVAGESDELQKKTFGMPITSYDIRFAFLPNDVVPVWKDCTLESELLGVTRRTEDELSGMEFWGGEYAPFDPYGRVAHDPHKKTYLGKWLKADMPLYKQREDKTLEEIIDRNGQQKWSIGCVQRKYIQITQEIPILSQVLGEATESALLAASGSAELEETDSIYADATVSTSSAGLEIVYLDKQESPQKKENLLKFDNKVSGEAVISSGLMNLLNIPEAKATNESFKISFIIIKNLMPSIQGKISTEEVVYKVVGVIDDDETQFVYIPIQDLTALGINNYSQVKLLLNDQQDMPEVRKLVETQGYKTASTVDTINQIESFFGGLRSVLGVIGFIALGVASLGMFNTLTVSLLERTREIGGMKTMGMVSGEIQELFLAEAMIMGFAGGIGGLLLGFFVGKLSSSLVSVVAIAQGVGYLELTHIPFGLVLFIVVSSFVVGLVTGLYPAYRAKKISALNALRYE